MSTQAELWLRVRSLLEEERELAPEGADHDGTEADGSASPRRARAQLRRTCRAAVRGLEVDGAGICLWTGEEGLMTAAASEPRYAEVEELQFVVGEGPCLSAFARRAPVLVPDLTDVTAVTWAAYPAAAIDLGVRAVFAFPLQLGGAQLGVLDVYRDRPGPLAPDSVTLALTFAEVVFLDLVQAVSETGGQVESLADAAAANRYEVYQAQGMVMVQLHVSAADALVLLRAHAFAHGVALVDLARDVIRRRVTLRRHDDDGP